MVTDPAADRVPGDPTPEASRVGPITRLVAKNAAVRATAELLGKVATLAWTVVVGRALSQADFGAIAYALALMLLVSALPTWGFNAVLIRRASVTPVAASRLYTQSLLWQTLVAVPVFLVVAFAATPSRPSTAATIVLVTMLVAGMPELWSDTARTAASARQQQAGVAAALVMQRLVTAMLIIGAVMLDMGAIGVAVGFLGGSLIGVVANIVALRRLHVLVQPRSVRWPDMRSMLSEAHLIGLSAVVLMVLFRVDAVLLAALKDDVAVASYAVAYRLLETVLFLAWSVRQAVMPVMSVSVSGERVRLAYERGMAAIAFIYLPFAALCLFEAEGIIRLLFGDAYATESAPMLQWLAPSPLLFAAAFLAFGGLVAGRQTGTLVVAASAASAVNIGLNLALIPSLAGVGAAIATTTSYAVLAGIALVRLGGTAGRVSVIRPLSEAGVAATAMALVLFGLDLPVLMELAAGGAVFLTVWLLLVWRFAPQQIAVLRSLVPGAHT